MRPSVLLLLVLSVTLLCLDAAPQRSRISDVSNRTLEKGRTMTLQSVTPSLHRPLQSITPSLFRPLQSITPSLLRPLQSITPSLLRPLQSITPSLLRPLQSITPSLLRPLQSITPSLLRPLQSITPSLLRPLQSITPSLLRPLLERTRTKRSQMEKRRCNTATCVTQRLADFLVRSGNSHGPIFAPTNVGSFAYGKRDIVGLLQRESFNLLQH